MPTSRPDHAAPYVLRLDGADDDRRNVLANDYEAHGGAVHRVASLLCGADVAADITQEVFLRLWRHPERFDPTRGTLRTYLLTIARSLAIDAARSAGARRAREERVVRAADACPVDTADDVVARSETADLVAQALHHLPAPERDAIVAAFYGGCSYREAAEVLGEPEGTVKSRIRAGLRHLRVLLADAQLYAVGT